MTARRALAGSTLLALLFPGLIVLATALHLATEHDPFGDHDAAARLAIARHGHGHAAGTAPHQHHAVFAGATPCGWSAAPMAALAVASVVTIRADPQPTRLMDTVKRGPPQPPPASSPILRL